MPFARPEVFVEGNEQVEVSWNLSREQESAEEATTLMISHDLEILDFSVLKIKPCDAGSCTGESVVMQ